MRILTLSLATYLATIFTAAGFTAAIAQTTPPPAGIISAQGPDHYLARDNLIGVKVHDSADKIVGDIEDLVINANNRVIGVVVGTGGVLGLGEKRVGIRLSGLNFADADGITHAVLVNLSKADLDAAAEFQRSKAPKSLLQRAKEKAQELTDKTSATSKSAYDKAKPSLDAAKDKVKETYEKAKDAAAPAIDAAKEAVTPNP